MLRHTGMVGQSHTRSTSRKLFGDCSRVLSFKSNYSDYPLRGDYLNVRVHLGLGATTQSVSGTLSLFLIASLCVCAELSPVRHQRSAFFEKIGP